MMPEGTRVCWTHILLRISKSDDLSMPRSAMRYTLVGRGAALLHLADARRILECLDPPARQKWLRLTVAETDRLGA